jgi:osmotically-inducible protein OsmY
MGTMVKKSDSMIQQDVLRELKWDTRVDETDVGVEVDNAVVTLTGTVSSWAKRMAAQDAAHRVAGVLDVANDIQVRVPGSAGRTDTEIAQAVRTALEWNVLVPDKRIQSTVASGHVTLTGTVDYWSQRDDAERVVRNLYGVRAITNRIELRPSYPIDADDVRASITAALERHAERHARDIQLEVREGRVTLSGIVHSWSEREAAVAAARNTAGVTEVTNRLQIEPYAP